MKFMYISPETARGLDLITWWGWILVVLVAWLLCRFSDAISNRRRGLWPKALDNVRRQRERDYWRKRLEHHSKRKA